MKQKLLMLLLPLLFLFSGRLNAQCDVQTMTITPTVTPVTCGANGQIVVETNATNPQYTLTGVNGFVAGPQNSNVFSSLAPGTYDLNVECSNGGEKTIQVTVADETSLITEASVSSTASCSNGGFNGTITINGITGGKAPYKISAIINSDVDYDDALSQYNTTTSTFPVTVNVTQAGTYQIRIKDACGEFYTVTQTLQSSYPQINSVWWGQEKASCSATGATPLAFTGFTLVTASGNLDMSTQVYGKMRMTIYEKSASGCSPANNTPLFDDILQDPETSDQTYNMAASHQYYVVFTDPCGNQSSVCFDNTETETKSADLVTKSSGCAGDNGSGIIVEGLDLRFMKFPVKVEFLDQGGNLVSPQPQIENTDPSSGNPPYDLANNTLPERWHAVNWQTKTPLPFGKYTVRFTDACGDTLNVPISDPSANTDPVAIAKVQPWGKWICFAGNAFTQLGTAQVGITFKGAVQDLANLKVTIVAPSASNIGDVAVYQDGQFFFSNLLPGKYTVQLTSPSNCAVYPVNLTFTVENNSDWLLTQRINSWGESFCSGGGNVLSQVENNTGYGSVVVLYDAAGNEIATSSTGNFYNLPAGTYTTKIRTQPTCAGSAAYYIDGSTVTLTGNSSGPKIVRRNGIICDSPGSTGKLYVELAGPLPITFRYKKQGTSTWTSTVVTDLSQPLVIDGLEANTTYDLLATACGKSTVSSVFMATAGQLTLDNTKQPCVGKPFTLSARKITGATYSWTYNGNALANTTNTLTFNSYTAADDGVYTVTANWGGCTVRTYTFTLDSSKCGQPFGTGTVSGNVFNDNTNDGNVNGTGIGNAGGTQLYITAVPADGSAPVTVAVAANGTYTFNNLPVGSYTLVLSTNPAGSTTPSLPSEWSNTGENIGANGTDGNPDGTLAVSFGIGQNVANANFGITKTVCYKPAATGGTVLDTNHGITSLGRAGAENGNWPMLRKGAWTALESKTKAFVINRLNTDQIQAIGTPVDGMMVYDTDAKCLKIYVENADPVLSDWHCFKKQGCPDN